MEDMEQDYVVIVVDDDRDDENLKRDSDAHEAREFTTQTSTHELDPDWIMIPQSDEFDCELDCDHNEIESVEHDTSGSVVLSESYRKGVEKVDAALAKLKAAQALSVVSNSTRKTRQAVVSDVVVLS